VRHLLLPATDHEHGRCTPHPPKLRVGNDTVSTQLGKAIAVVSASSRQSLLSVTVPK
jgi:hypothetical protein